MQKKINILFLIFIALLGMLCACEDKTGELLDGLFIGGRITQAVYLAGEPKSSVGVVNVEVTLTDVATDEDWVVYTAEDGSYRFENLGAGEYSVVPAKAHWKFDQDSYTVTLTDRRVDDRDFVGSAAGSGYVLDPWGAIWDAIPTTAPDWQTAYDDCLERGGRLPTATELFRNRANNAAFGTNVFPSDTTYLVTQVRNDLLNYVTVRSSDGDASWTAEADEVTYRCIWPPRNYNTFKGSSIYTLPGQEPYQVKVNGKRFYMDQLSRPLLTFDGALNEAAFYNAAIPSLTIMGMAIQDGLAFDSTFAGEDSGAHFTDDFEIIDNGHLHTGVVLWHSDFGAAYNGTYSDKTSWRYTSNSLSYRHSFRCIGVSDYPSPVYPDLDESTWFDPGSRVKADLLDNPALIFPEAVSACFARGGHLPDAQELAFLIKSGLPNGRWSLYTWTADFYNNQYNGIIRWNGIDPLFYLDYNTYGTRLPSWSSAWAAETSTVTLFRTAYYPLDTEYNGPDPNLVNMDQITYYKKTRPDGQVLKIWVDAVNRPSVSFKKAMASCYNLGGELVSMQDVIELVRAGALEPNNSFIWTSDYCYNQQFELIRWPETGTDFLATYDNTVSYGSLAGQTGDVVELTQSFSAAATDADLNAAPVAYRCIWTNELRTP